MTGTPPTTSVTERRALSADRAGDVLVITIDVPGMPVNTLGLGLARELDTLFDEVEQNAGIRGVVLISGKPDVFIAGADIEQFLDFRTAADAERSSSEAHRLLNRLERLRVPVVAAINGACLGAGLETALACHYRVATDHPKTVLGFPEVQLGLIPGAGGTQRLPRRVGLRQALDMILRGRNLRSRKALEIGLVDELVPSTILREVALRRARDLGSGDAIRRAASRRGAVARLVEANPVGRAAIFRAARKSVLKQTHGHYPAPLAALEAVRAGYGHSLDEGLSQEARLFGQMAMTETSRQLIFLFFASNSLKKDPGVAGTPSSPRPVEKLAVLGAGFMGAGIAAIAVQQGTLVRLKDTDTARIGRGLAAVRDVLRERLNRRQITPLQFQDMMAMTGGTVTYSGFSNVDLVVEAVFEDLELKKRVLREAESLLPARAIYASNTSTIPIARIAEASRRPDRVLGMHFFSPVHRMPLLEVIVTRQTAGEATVTAVAYGKKLGKTVIVVNDGPGFYTTRVLAAYMNEAGRLLDEGAPIEQIDQSLVDFGFPVGPVTLLDEVGIDVGGKVGKVMADAFGTRMAPSNAMVKVALSGRSGRKGGLGFYRYDANGKKHGVDESVYEAAGLGRPHKRISNTVIERRCVMALVNEAVRCLEGGIVRSARDGDVGAVFGIGFPPFRGGPFRYIDSLGADAVVRVLEELNGQFAPRFAPADLLLEHARSGRTFYPERGRPVP